MNLRRFLKFQKRGRGHGHPLPPSSSALGRNDKTKVHLMKWSGVIKPKMLGVWFGKLGGEKLSVLR